MNLLFYLSIHIILIRFPLTRPCVYTCQCQSSQNLFYCNKTYIIINPLSHYFVLFYKNIKNISFFPYVSIESSGTVCHKINFSQANIMQKACVPLVKWIWPHETCIKGDTRVQEWSHRSSYRQNQNIFKP